jgi:hypothetical protein
MKAKPHPFSMRLSPRLDARITTIARRTRRSKAAVMESLIDEADRCQRYPGIAFRGDDWRRRPWVISTALDVWEIIRALHDWDDDIAAMARDSDLSEAQIRLAASYYAEFRDEIDERIDEERRVGEAILRGEYPFIQVVTIPD